MATVWATLLFLSAAATELRHRGAGPLCSCDCCSVAQRRADERKNQMGLKCAPSEGHSRELCSSLCRPSDEAVGFLAKDRLLDYSRFCFYDCKPPQGHLSALASQCLSLKDSELQQALDADGNAMDPAFLYEAPAAIKFPVALAKDPAKAKAVAKKAHKAFKKLENGTEDVEELWDSDVATEIPDATQDPLVAASGARRAAQRAEDAAVRAKRAAERSIEALKTGRNDTWMAAMWKANEALNTMKRNDFRQATAAQRHDAPVPWRVRAAEAARSAAAPYLENVVGIVIAPCYGVPARDFAAIQGLCKERGLWLCEDACESYGASCNVRGFKVPVGSVATLSVVSVRSEKMIGVGEGGAILGNDATLVARAKWWCSRAPCRGVGLWRVYEHDAVGQNFRMPEMLAAVGCAAAEMLPVMIERKRAIHSWYEQGIAARPGLKGVRLQHAAPGDDSVWWINAALLPEGLSGEEVGMQLMKTYPDIEIRPGFFPLDMMAIFQSSWSKPCPNAQLLYQRLVCLPSSNQLQKEDVDRVCSALLESIEAVSA